MMPMEGKLSYLCCAKIPGEFKLAESKFLIELTMDFANFEASCLNVDFLPFKLRQYKQQLNKLDLGMNGIRGGQSDKQQQCLFLTLLRKKCIPYIVNGGTFVTVLTELAGIFMTGGDTNDYQT